jgi:hypothetical protein
MPSFEGEHLEQAQTSQLVPIFQEQALGSHMVS